MHCRLEFECPGKNILIRHAVLEKVTSLIGTDGRKMIDHPKY
jgi:hypothetical protein